MSVNPGPSDTHQNADRRASFVVRLPATPATTRELRTRLCEWLQHLSWPPDEIEALGLAVYETCMNVVCHAYAVQGAGEIELSGRVHDRGPRRHVVATVRDWGHWKVPTERHAGIGLALARELVHNVNVRTTAEGTEVSIVSCAVQPAPDPPACRSGNGVAYRRGEGSTAPAHPGRRSQELATLAELVRRASTAEKRARRLVAANVELLTQAQSTIETSQTIRTPR